ncbi:MAG: iron ABC transporter permease [Acidimicrobiia bacterium]
MAAPPASARRSRSRLGLPPPRGRGPVWAWMVAVVVLGPATATLVWMVVANVGRASGALEAIGVARTLELLANTLGLAAATTATALIIGLGGAWVTTRTDLAGRRVWTVLLALPLIFPSYVGALALVGAFGPEGIVSGAFGLGVGRPGGFWGSWAALSLFNAPYAFLLGAVALRRMDPALEEAARSLGLGPSATFVRVVLPQLRPTMAAAGLLVALYTIADFGAVSFMGFDTFTRAIYSRFRIGDIESAIAIAAVLVVIAVLLLLVVRDARRTHTPVATPDRPPTPIALGTWGRVGAVAGLATVVTLSVILPIVVLVGWTLRGASAATIGDLWSATLGSLAVAAPAGVATALVAVPVALLVVRHPNRSSMALDRVQWGLYSLPHLAVALALLVFALQVARPLYQTIPLLVLAFVTMFLPQATGSLADGLHAISPRLEESARSLGRGPVGAFVGVTAPLIRPHLVTGALLVFLTTMKELPATLLLRPTGLDTLSVRIWSAVEEGFLGRASAASLILLAVSAIPMYLLSTRDLRAGTR